MHDTHFVKKDDEEEEEDSINRVLNFMVCLLPESRFKLNPK